MNYQDVLINGKIIKKGYGPPCEARYQAIRQYLFSNYRRPFTVLEIGAGYGYNAFRALKDFKDCYYVMIERLNGLLYICEQNTFVNDRAIILNTFADTPMIRLLAEKEHFDVIIMCNLLNHLGDAYMDWIDQSLKMCSHLIIGTPAPIQIRGSKTIERMIDFIHSFPNVEVIAKIPRRREKNLFPPSPIFWIKNAKSEFIRGGQYEN